MTIFRCKSVTSSGQWKQQPVICLGFHQLYLLSVMLHLNSMFGQWGQPHDWLIQANWTDETNCSASFPAWHISSGPGFSDAWSCRWLGDWTQAGWPAESGLPRFSAWRRILVFCADSLGPYRCTRRSRRLERAQQGIAGIGTWGAATVPIKSSLLLREFDLI